MSKKLVGITLPGQVPEGKSEPKFSVDLLGLQSNYKSGSSTAVYKRWEEVTRVERFEGGAIAFMVGEQRVTIVPGNSTVIIEEVKTR